MNRKTYSSEGVVLARKNYGEADRILVVFSKHFGKLYLLAKGVRKPESRKRGHIEVFSYLKFSATKGKGIDLMIEADVIDSFAKIRGDLKKITVAYFFMEVLGRILREGEKHEDIYNLTFSYMEDLTNGSNLKKLRSEFVYNILVTSGFWPEGKYMNNPDLILEEIIERRMNSLRVGKRILI